MTREAPRGLAWLQENWDRLGRSDPFWAVLTDPARRGGRWSRDEFFATGRAEIDDLLRSIASLLPERRRALDFGCGPGRLTQALAVHFDRVDGVDVAPSMVELAKDLDRALDTVRPGGLESSRGERVFHLNAATDLGLFSTGTFDLAYSNITLQHVRPRLAEGYLAELIRVLHPGGVLVFQLPARRLEPVGLAQRLRRVVKRLAPDAAHRLWRRATRNREPLMEMHAIPRERVERVIARAGGELVEPRPDDAPGTGWESYRYVVVKPRARG